MTERLGCLSLFCEMYLTVNDPPHSVLEHFLLFRIHLEDSIVREPCGIRSFHPFLRPQFHIRPFRVNLYDRFSSRFAQLEGVRRSEPLPFGAEMVKHVGRESDGGKA